MDSLRDTALRRSLLSAIYMSATRLATGVDVGSAHDDPVRARPRQMNGWWVRVIGRHRLETGLAHRA